MVPTVHLNGTSRKQLEVQLEEVGLAIQSAIRALGTAAPNGRDYYPQGPLAINRAVVDHLSRLEKLQDVYDDIMMIYEGVVDQNQR